MCTEAFDVSAEDLRPNELEWGYYGLAMQMHSPELCSKISPEAYLTAGFAPKGSQISYTRSYCFLPIAIATKNRSLCANVRQKTHPLLDGSDFTKEHCEARVNSSEPAMNIAVAFKPELILRLIGYGDDRAQITQLASTKEQAFFELYLSLARSPEFQKKLSTLPDFSTSDDDGLKQLKTIAPQCFPDTMGLRICCLIHEALRRDGNSNECPPSKLGPQEIGSVSAGDQNAKSNNVASQNGGPVLIHITVSEGKSRGTMEISWETDRKSDGIVNWGESESYGSHLSDFNFELFHQISVPVASNKLYHFAIRSCIWPNPDPHCTSSLDMTFQTK